MSPFRDLLAKTKRLYWDSQLEEVFTESKAEIVKLIRERVKIFELNRETCLSIDWSKKGIGYSLMQKPCSCAPPLNPNFGSGNWKIVFSGSRFTTAAESRYAPIEGETLALVYGLNSCKMFVMGCPKFLVAVDHKSISSKSFMTQEKKMEHPIYRQGIHRSQMTLETKTRPKRTFQ